MSTPAWQAAMIGPDDEHAGAPLLRTERALDAGHGPVTAAVLHATARGVFTAYAGGAGGARAVSDEVLSPGWSSYEWRLRYRSYDVTQAVRTAGSTVVLGIALGNGWWRGRLGWHGRRALYGTELGALAQLEIGFADGHRQLVRTDASWQAGPSAVLANDLYDGQHIDARRVDDAWLWPGFAAGPGWGGVHVQEFDHATLTPYLGPVVRRSREIAPARIWTSPAGRTLVDFGENVVGWVRAALRGPAGSTVTVRHAEVLQDGELATRPLRSAEATDRFVLSGGDDVFEPSLTFHGFRYAEFDGWPGTPEPAAVTAVVVHSELRRTGRFRCSVELLNRLHDNVARSMRGNFLDVPTDCPQRDERLGWTGDIAVFTPSAAFLYDVGDFLGDWLLDVDAEQRAADGLVPFVVPDVLKYSPATELPAMQSTAVWSDAAVWVPWALWQAYGDTAALRRGYGAMLAHVRRVAGLRSANGLWDTGFQFGDWLDPAAPPDDPFRARADPGVVATACLYRSARTVAAAARLLGHEDDAAYCASLADRVRAAFTEHYVGADGRVHSDAVTCYALAIHFGLLDGHTRALAGDRLAELVAAGGHRIATGFAGTPYVCDALTETGHLADAYRLLLQQECPSWLYPVTMGATTMWERWDSMLPDGRVNPGQMTSFNHYALGAVVDWLHRTVGGIAPAEPGYRAVHVAPRPGGGLRWAETSLDTPHGPLAVHWRLDPDGGLDVQVSAPPGVTVRLDVPGTAVRTVTGGTHHVRGRSTPPG